MYRKVYEQAKRPEKTDAAFARDAVSALRDSHPYMFSFSGKDDDPYEWVRSMGAYSPIMHMQQTDGVKSSQRPSRRRRTKTGSLRPLPASRTLKESFDAPAEDGMPPKADHVTLAFEIFISNVSYPHDALEDLRRRWPAGSGISRRRTE